MWPGRRRRARKEEKGDRGGGGGGGGKDGGEGEGCDEKGDLANVGRVSFGLVAPARQTQNNSGSFGGLCRKMKISPARLNSKIFGRFWRASPKFCLPTGGMIPCCTFGGLFQNYIWIILSSRHGS